MDMIFKALADPARRTLLDALREADGQTLTDLQAHLDMTRFGVMKHLGVLEEAGLIVTIKRGRFKYHYLNAVPLQQVIDRWIDPLIAKPTARGLLDLKSKLEGNVKMPDPKPDFILETFIRTTQDALWDALTKADDMAAYHFVCNDVRGDVAPGQTTEFVLPDGNVMLGLTALALDPKSRIEMTFQPHFFGPDAANSRMVYLIKPEGDTCRLTLEHYDIPTGQESVGEGWSRLTASLKSYLETGKGLKMAMGGAA